MRQQCRSAKFAATWAKLESRRSLARRICLTGNRGKRMTRTISKAGRAVQVSGSFDPQHRRTRLLGSGALAAGTLRGLALVASVAAGVTLGGSHASAGDYAAGGATILAPSGHSPAPGARPTTPGAHATPVGGLDLAQ